jgi:hypothetical protein
MVGSAGIDPWLEIELKAQERLILSNTKNISDCIWISGNPSLKITLTQRLLIFIGRIRMWHYPDRSHVFRFFIGALRRIVLLFPTKQLMKFALPQGVEKSIGRRVGHRVEQDLPISMFISSYRTISSFEWALANLTFDYLLRITSTCLVNEGPLLEFINGLPRKRVYAGKQMNEDFISGAALVLSRDVVEKVVSKQGEMRHEFYEDVALGKLIREFHLADFREMKRVDFASPEEVMLSRIEDIRMAPVIRCKAEPSTQSAQKVIEVFKAVTERLGWSSH